MGVDWDSRDTLEWGMVLDLWGDGGRVGGRFFECDMQMSAAGSSDLTSLGHGRRFVAGFLGVLWAVPLVLVSASMAGHWLGDGFSEWGLLILLLLPVAGWFGWRLGVESRNWRWRFYGMVVLGLGGVAFGEVMEGAEGALWGGLIGGGLGF